MYARIMHNIGYMPIVLRPIYVYIVLTIVDIDKPKLGNLKLSAIP